VVASKRDQLRFVEQMRDGPALSELRESSRHLCQRNGLVQGGDWDVAAVDDLGPVLVWVDVGTRIEASERCLTGRCLTDCSGAEPGTWSGMVQ
jgi:hypothetical protein